MDTRRIIQSWLDAAGRDWDVAKNLFKLKHYAYSLFFCHLTVEKLLKALVVQNTSQHAPPIHELKKLAKLAKLKPTSIQKQHLETLTTFNIKARYDDIKQSFYKQATKDFAKKYLKITEEISAWLKGNLH
jgi:HEPN domain-containing protein